MKLLNWMIHTLGGHTDEDWKQMAADLVAIGRLEAARAAFHQAAILHMGLQALRDDLSDTSNSPDTAPHVRH